MSSPLHPAVRWGDASKATKKALLLHGASSAPACYWYIAQQLVAAGYYCVAPALAGHADGNRLASYEMANYAKDLEPVLAELGSIDLLIAHSLGGPITTLLFPSIKLASSARLILLDPPLELSDALRETYRVAISGELENVPSQERYLEENPKWKTEDAKWKEYGAKLCSLDCIHSTFRVNGPWSFTELVPQAAENLEVILLGSEDDPCVSVEDALAFKSKRQTTKVAIALGSGHSIHRDSPDMVVRLALTGNVSTDKELKEIVV